MFRLGVVLLSIFLVGQTSVGAEGDAAVLAAPEPDPAAVIAELPFLRPEEANRIYVDLAPEGGQPLVLMLDTGAQFTVMTPLAARALGVSVRKIKRSPYRRSTRLGRDLQFRVDVSTSDTGSKTGWEYGLLGGNFLEHYVVELDFQERRVRFLDPKLYRVPEHVTASNQTVIPVQVTARRPFTRVEIDGKKAHVAIDTGAPFGLELSGQEARKVGIDPDSLPYFGEMGTVMGGTPGHIGEVDSFRFAGFELGRVPVVVMPRGWYNQGGSSDSVIGYDVLRQFKLRLDYPRGRLWLERRDDTRVTFHGADYEAMRETGAYLGRIPGRGWWVHSVLPGSPAERLGLKRGDAIVGRTTGLFAPGLEDTVQRIRDGAEIRVLRAQEGDARVTVSLGRPDPVVDEAAAPPAPTAEERRETWQERMSERLFVYENGGWRVVEDWRRRIGPKEGEVWVSYDEMSEMKRTGRVPEAASE